MVQINRIENFIRKAIWRITRSDSLIKYIPKSLKNGIVISDCAVLINKKNSYDIFSKQRKPIKRDISNRKVAICIATIMNQFTEQHRDKLDNLLHLDKEYSSNLAEFNRQRGKKTINEDAVEYLEDRLVIISTKIDQFYTSMTL